MLVYSVCAIIGLIFIVSGVLCLFAKKPVAFYIKATKKHNVADVKKYNKSIAKMLISYGLAIILFSIPILLAEQNSMFFLIPIFGIILSSQILIFVHLNTCVKNDTYNFRH